MIPFLPILHLDFWQKYRPLLLRLMIDSADSQQEYQFSEYEFREINPKKSGGYPFILIVHRCKALNNIRGSELAQNLLSVLKSSRTAVELTDASTYEIMLDKKFVLSVRKAEDLPDPEEQVVVNKNEMA